MEQIMSVTGLGKFGGGVLVPTMGALHEGHAALVRLARHRAGGKPVVVSVFVNPTQFGEAADFARYPRTLEKDAALCEGSGADVVFAPALEEVYPGWGTGEAGAGGGGGGGAGGGVRVPELPRVATAPGLEDAARPGHFAGVCQVVRRLFELVRPSAAVFGEKDWQQLQVVRAMVEQEGLGIEIIPGETVRDEDGLAMSSRNRFLSPEERERGLALSRGLKACRAAVDPDEGEGLLRRVLGEAGIEPDYAVIRDAATLEPRRAGEWDRSRTMRAVVAGRVGSVRLLDNAAWEPM